MFKNGHSMLGHSNHGNEFKLLHITQSLHSLKLFELACLNFHTFKYALVEKIVFSLQNVLKR